MIMTVRPNQVATVVAWLEKQVQQPKVSSLMTKRGRVYVYRWFKKDWSESSDPVVERRKSSNGKSLYLVDDRYFCRRKYERSFAIDSTYTAWEHSGIYGRNAANKVTAAGISSEEGKTHKEKIRIPKTPKVKMADLL